MNSAGGRQADMSTYEVPQPIINSPYEEPAAHWHLEAGKEPEKREGRRPATYFYRPPGEGGTASENDDVGTAVELELVNRIRARLKEWRPLALRGEGGVTRTTMELMNWWRREGRNQRLFFAQLEAAETIIFLVEARADFLQGIDVPVDEPGEDRRADGFSVFRRYALKMATGTGKTTVMGMLAAWSILNKVNDRSDARFSDVVLVVCPNVTIRSRLAELDPGLGEASLFRTRDLVPEHLIPLLSQGRVQTTNWHVFEPQTVQVAGTSARVNKAGRLIRTVETIRIGPKSTVARGARYLSNDDFERQVGAGLLTVLEEQRDRSGQLVKARVESARYVESDTSVVQRVLREVRGKRNILVMNDEAHHAYRIRREEPDTEEKDEEEDLEEFYKEATVWIDGLDRINRERGINFCVDLSATPYYLGRVGQDTNRTFPWVVSDFGLVDAIESGLVKIPQLAVRDPTGAAIPGYFNIWRWILPKLTPAERGGKRASPKPEAILKWANVPVAMLGGLWQQTLGEKQAGGADPRPPVFILVCKNTKIAGVVYEWLANDNPPAGIPPARLPDLFNRDGKTNTIRVDTKVVHETDTGEAKSDEMRWMRLTLDTVGKLEWPRDRQGRPIYPEGFEELAAKLKRPLHPPGRDVRCIVSVGMLTEGWDCNTVTHIVGLRPFMSQLLCEQVVGRGLRRTSYDVNDDGFLSEEVAKIFGVPFQVIPFKQNPTGPRPPKTKTWHIHAVPERAELEIRFPRVEGYQQAIRNRVTVDWKAIAPLRLDPMQIPPEVQMKAGLPTNEGRPSLTGPGKLESVDLNPYRSGQRLQMLAFQLARDLMREYVRQPTCEAPAHALFPQVLRIVTRYLDERVQPIPPAEKVDAFLSPYYGWMIERLLQEIRPDAAGGEAPEVPRYEAHRGPGTTAEVDFHTRREPYPVIKSHVNSVVPDTEKWEQSAAYVLDTYPFVRAFAKNAGLGFSIPYLHNGQPHEYLPDFIVRPVVDSERFLILETKGYDELKDVKAQAAQRWVAAVNADGNYGRWSYAVASNVGEIAPILARIARDS